MKSICKDMKMNKILFFFCCFFILSFQAHNTEPITILSSSPVSSKRFWVHKAVFNSLLRGLKKINYPFILNPDSLEKMSNIVYINASKEILKEIIDYKNSTNSNLKIFVGPNVGFNQEPDPYLRQWMVDNISVNFFPCHNIFNGVNVTEVKNKCKVWYAGVDDFFWTPSSEIKKDSILIYFKLFHRENEIKKNQQLSRLEKIKELIKNKCYRYELVNYGSYDTESYKKSLNRSIATVYLGYSESQGIALAESWSMDVPTFVLNLKPQIITKQNNSFTKEKTKINLSPAPYLSNETGAFWSTFEELNLLLENLINKKTNYCPRKWVVNNMTDEHSAKLFIDLILEICK